MAMSAAQSFEDLLVWQKSHQLVLRVYKMTSTFPKAEIFGLCSQMRRAAVSVPANIAEAFKRRSRPDKARVMNIAQGSLEELGYYFLLVKELGYTDTTTEREKTDEVARMLYSYIASVSSSR